MAGYNTNDIAHLAGVSIGSLYQYFPNKAAISAALIEREMAALLDAVQEIVREDAAVRLDRLVAVAVDHQLRRPVLARLLDIEEEQLPSTTDLDDLRGKLASVIHACILAPGLTDGAALPLVEDVIAIIKGMVDAAGRRGETDAGDLARRVMRAVAGYVGRSAPT